MALDMVITEEQFMKSVIELAQWNKWKIAHFRPARTGRMQNGKPAYITPVQADGKGFPDLVMVRHSRIIFAELKSEKGRLTEEQAEWIGDLEGTRKVEVKVWHPSDWDEIAEVLK